MIHLAICDDERIETDYLTTLVQQWASERHVLVRISDYNSAESFLFAYEVDASIDILLLDIQMKVMDGVALARQIREGNDAVQIIFITGYPDFMAEGYEVSALHYLLKPVHPNKLFEVLDRAAKQVAKSSELLLLPVDDAYVRIPADDILYVEASNHTLEVRTTHETYTVKMPLYELEGKLTRDFVRCHRCYVVNLRYIRKITRTEVTLDSGCTLPLSRRLYADVNRAMMRYLTGGEDAR